MTKGTRHLSLDQPTIPAGLARYVGRIVTKWANFEFRIQRIICTLAGVDEAVGRLAIREPMGIGQRLDLMRDLFELRGVRLDPQTFKALRHNAEVVSRKRNTVAHGLWTTRGGEWFVIETRGDVPDHALQGVQKSRKVRPESMKVTSEGLQKIDQEIDNLIEGARRCTELAKVPQPS